MQLHLYDKYESAVNAYASAKGRVQKEDKFIAYWISVFRKLNLSTSLSAFLPS
jgi:hypothetical protein